VESRLRPDDLRNVITYELPTGSCGVLMGRSECFMTISGLGEQAGFGLALDLGI
jgi:hypothetical protein